MKEMSGHPGWGRQVYGKVGSEANYFCGPESEPGVPLIPEAAVRRAALRERTLQMMSNSAGLDLQAAVDRFCALEQRAATISPSELYHSALSRLVDVTR